MNEQDFWSHPLGAWLTSVSSGSCSLVPSTAWRRTSRRSLPIQYRELCDGVLLTLLFREIDPKSIQTTSIGPADSERDNVTKQRIFVGLLEAIRTFYKHRLHQLIVLSPPDILSIVRNWTPDDSGEELNKFLLLLLGCAVQGDKKKSFVERITRLPSETQIGIVRHIQKVTEGSSVVLSLQSLAVSSPDGEIVCHLERVMRERDILAQQIIQMNNDNESDEGSSTTATSSLNGDIPQRRTEIRYDGRRSPSPPLERHSHSVEVLALKAKLRKEVNSNEEKDEENHMLRKELDAKDDELIRLQEERLTMVKEAQRAKELEDELDCIKYKLTRLAKLEKDNEKLIERQFEFDYLKEKAEKLSAENDSLLRSMGLVEDELEELQQRTKNQSETECRLHESQSTVKGLQSDLVEKNARIEQLLQDQSRLETELMLMNNRVTELQQALDDPSTPRVSFGSLAEQIEESERGETVRLRMEVKRLKTQLEKMDKKEESNPAASAELEQLRSELQQHHRQMSEIRDENEVVTKQLHELEKTLSLINGDYKEASEQLSNAREERDEAVHGLHEARRKFAQFQTEFGKKFEREAEIKVREVEVELSEMRRKMTSSEEERSEIERQLERVRDEQRNLRKTVDDLKECNHQLELQLEQAERATKNAENEKNVMKDRSEKLAEELESQRMKIIAADDTARRLEHSERSLVEQQNRLGDVEAENRSISQQLELESKKTQRLREDLVSEKTKGAELVSRLRSLCASVALNGGKIDKEIDDMELISSIDDVIMGALNAARREADASRLQQHTQIAELNDLRRDIEKLRRSESASLSESDDRVRELSKENISMKEQVFILQEKLREIQIEVSTKTSEIVSAKREIEELNRNSTTATASNSDLARLQVSLRNLQLQEELLKQDNADLREQLLAAEKNKTTAKRETDSLVAMHQVLLSDHDRLQNLHDLLTQDYEHTKQECLDLKGRMRAQRQSPVSVPSRELEELRSLLSQERASKDKQLRAYADLNNENGAARRDIEALRKENDCLSRNCDGLSSEIRNLKLADQAHRLTIRDLNQTVEELTKSLNQKEIEIAKLCSKIEMLSQLKRANDDNLAKQMDLLLRQNKDLHDRALNDKDHYHNEQRGLQEQLADLRRHKEKLEDKIMDTYKSMENKRCDSVRAKQPLVKRAAKALINRRRPSQPSSNGSTTEDSSTYSADEAPPTLNGHDEFDIFPPTSSSSEDPDRVSPRYESIASLREPPTIPELPAFRCRNDLIGGSVRVPSSTLRRPIINGGGAYDQLSLDGNPINAVADSTPLHLPPRAPVRNSSVTSSLRVRPPPPPYPRNKPPAYGARNNTPPVPPLSSSPVMQFIPQLASTPKSSPSRDERVVVAEGEKRTFVREKEERLDKAMSIYENVSQVEPPKGPNESTVWYEYGCV